MVRKIYIGSCYNIFMHSTELQYLLAIKPYGKNIAIPKDIMERLPRGTKPTILGDMDGALQQYRCPPNLHILEYPDFYKVHKDMRDPREDPIGHIVHDSPETGVALIAGGAAGMWVGKRIYNWRKKESGHPVLEAATAGFITALVIGGIVYYVGKLFRKNA